MAIFALTSVAPSGCSEGAPGCGNEMSRESQVVADELTTYTSLKTVSVVDDCDSGGRIYVDFYTPSLQDSEQELGGDSRCAIGDSQDSTATSFTCEYNGVKARIDLDHLPSPHGYGEVTS